jgi:hypothetical protein
MWLVAAGSFDIVGDAGGLERLGGVVVHLGTDREEGVDQAPRVGTRGGQERPDAVTDKNRCRKVSSHDDYSSLARAVTVFV